MMLHSSALLRDVSIPLVGDNTLQDYPVAISMVIYSATRMYTEPGF